MYPACKAEEAYDSFDDKEKDQDDLKAIVGTTIWLDQLDIETDKEESTDESFTSDDEDHVEYLRACAHIPALTNQSDSDDNKEDLSEAEMTKKVHESNKKPLAIRCRVDLGTLDKEDDKIEEAVEDETQDSTDDEEEKEGAS